MSNQDDPQSLAQAQKLIPATVRMFSGCHDSQTSADVSNVANFKLPDPAGRAGGACTSVMLKILYNNPSPTFQKLLMDMREELKNDKFSQIPQLSSSRPMHMKETPFAIVPKGFSGTKRAVMIGINYVGSQSQLSGCQSDCLNMKKYLIDKVGFQESEITLLLDDGKHTNPTYANIMNAYKKVVADSVAGDVVFCHYSGHGGKLRDDDGDEADGYDETLVPVDYESAGQIRDDDIFKALVGPMKKGVTMTCIFDCCHSGTVLDLPYQFKADGVQQEMSIPLDFDFSKLQGLFETYLESVKSGKPMTEQEVIGAITQMCGPNCAIL